MENPEMLYQALEEKDKRIKQLENEVLALRMTNAQQASQLKELQATVAKQQKTIHHELRTIKSIASKRADNRAKSTGSIGMSGMAAFDSANNTNGNRSSSKLPAHQSSTLAVPQTVSATRATSAPLLSPSTESPPRRPHRQISDDPRLFPIERTMSSGSNHASIRMSGEIVPPIQRRPGTEGPTMPLRASTAHTSDTFETFVTEDEEETFISLADDTNETPDARAAFRNMPKGSTSTMSTITAGSGDDLGVPPPPTDPPPPLSEVGTPKRVIVSSGPLHRSLSQQADSNWTLDTETDEVIYKSEGKEDGKQGAVGDNASPQRPPPSISEDKKIAVVPTQALAEKDRPAGDNAGATASMGTLPAFEPIARQLSEEKSLTTDIVFNASVAAPPRNASSNDIVFAPAHTSQQPQEFSMPGQDIQFNASAPAVEHPPQGQLEFSLTARDIQFNASAPVTLSKNNKSREIKFDPRDGAGQWSSRAPNRGFDSSNQLLFEASQALTGGLQTPTPMTRKSRKSVQMQQSAVTAANAVTAAEGPPLTPPPPTSQRQEIVFSPSAHAKRTSVPLHSPMPSTGHKSLLVETGASNPTKAVSEPVNANATEYEVYGGAAVATQEDEEDDEYDHFGEDLPFTNREGFLEYQRSFNLSPVSALTTGSYLRDKGLIDPDEEEELGPRKAIHNSGLTKRLPMEDMIDSEEDDSAVEQIEEDEEDIFSRSKRSQPELMTDDDDDEDELDGPVQFADPPQAKGAREQRLNHSQHSARQNGSEHPPSQQVSLHSEKSNESVLQETPIGSPKVKRPQPTIQVDDSSILDKYGDGGHFVGTVTAQERLPHGFGKMVYSSGLRYEGDWKEGRWHGFGRWASTKGDCYEGTFVYDVRHGNGTYTWNNGNVYKGDFFEDKRHGKGVFNFRNGSVYQGDFNNGVFEGHGSYEFDGGFYEGQWKSGKYNGTGFLSFCNGSSYRGDFEDGVANGTGEETQADGSVRRGIWEKGKIIAVL